MEDRICSLCSQTFSIQDDDTAFYQKVNLPPATFCPQCRSLRRLVFRNDRKLYHRSCDLCKKPILATYEVEAPFPVYCPSCWWSDKWDASSYARDYDFSQSFFEQWDALNRSVPHISLWQIQNENSDYTHDASYNKNSYMLFGADYNRDCYYCWSTVRCKDVCDGAALFNCERLYECTDCLESQFCTHSQLLRNSSECYFCFDLQNCHNCFGSAGLRNKSYYFFNQRLSPDRYAERMKTIDWSPRGIAENWKKAHEEHLKVPRRYVQQKNCEDCSGAYLGNCKNVQESFDCENDRDCKYCLLAYETKDAHDAEVLFYNIELIFESQTLIKNCNRVFFSYFLRDVSQVFYGNECYMSHDLFGCVGLRNKSFSILNKSYSERDYKTLLDRITEAMKQRGEWGEFFPVRITPFAYNESAAFDYLTRLSKEQALALGLRWKEDNPREFKAQTYQIPDLILDVPDSICQETLACEYCKKNYRIVPQELAFYRFMKLPIPRWCFECRHLSRLARRGPRLLFDRNCQRCGLAVRSIFASDKPEIVYCEKCYLETVY